MAPHEDGSMDAIPRRQFIMFDDSLFPTKKTFEECCVSNPYLGEARYSRPLSSWYKHSLTTANENAEDHVALCRNWYK